MLCPASLVLPRVRSKPASTIDAANYGTLVHHWKETGEVAPTWADNRHVDLLRRKLEATGVRREQWWQGGEHEATFALNLTTLEIRRHWDRPTADAWKKEFGPAWLTGTIDWVQPALWWLDDLKTGAWPVDPTKSAQLRSYALFLWAAEGCPAQHEGYTVTITQWPKYPISGVPRRKRHHLMVLDLECHLDDLRWSLAHPKEFNPTTEGCKFCDGRPVCPAVEKE